MGTLSVEVLVQPQAESRSKFLAFLAVCTWVNMWLFLPFGTFFLIWYFFGILYAVAFWVGLGCLMPRLSQKDGVRQFINEMRFWIDGAEVVGEAPRRTGDGGGKPMLHCHHPHGAVAINPCSKGGLDLSIRAVVAPLCFRMPLCRQMMEAMGAISSKKAEFTKYMQTGKDFAVIPGGVEEVVLGDQHHERLFLRHRKGFVKYALTMGYDLLPVYHFGETQLYTICWPLTTAPIVRLRLAIARKTQIATGFGYGCWFMPNLPKLNQKCITVIGERIELPRIDEPSREDVDRYHSMYIERLTELYNQHRHRLPEYVNKPLEIW